MAAFWEGLTALHQGFVVAAIFFSTIFIWQLVSAFGSLGESSSDVGETADSVGDADGMAGIDTDAHDLAEADGGDDLLSDSTGLATFRLLSVRSIIAFGTLFSWGGALYLGQDISTGSAILRATLWGGAGMLVVALFFWVLPRLTETGTADMNTALGQSGEVYMNIPAGGSGQVKVLVSGAVRFVRARSEDGQAIAAGAPVHIVKIIDGATLLVRDINS